MAASLHGNDTTPMTPDVDKALLFVLNARMKIDALYATNECARDGPTQGMIREGKNFQSLFAAHTLLMHV